MVSFRQFHSHLKLLSNNDLKGTRTEYGFKHAFATLFGQDLETFTSTLFLNMDQLEKQLDNKEFQEIGSMAAFKKSIDKRALHKREYDNWVNERQMQTTEENADMSNALDASLVDTENIRPIYDEEPMAEVQTTAKINVFAIGQQHIEQPKFNNEGEVDQNAEQCHDKRYLPAKLTDNQITELSYQSLESENICLKKTVAQFQKYFSRMKAHCVNLELKYQNQALKEGQHGQFSKVKSKEAKVPTRKIFTSSTTTVDSEPPNGSNTDITNLHECIQNLDSSAGTSINVQEEQTLALNAVTMEILPELRSNSSAVGPHGTRAEGDLRKFSDIGAWVQVPRCMAWLDYDEHVDSLSTMDNEVGVTSPESTTQTLPSFEEYTQLVSYLEEVEKTLGTLIEVEPLNETKLEEVGLNYNHKTPLSSREVPSFDGSEPQPLLNSPSLDVSLEDVIGPEPPIKPHSLDNSRMKVIFDEKKLGSS
ncbi:hypothetical protein Tco_0859368 [Tanacetum coccineum]|uniref:Uncharacterized protein n=1 Tax=Tanacetum coccineum TaxID=301880 RepID=A0ABQ5BCI2_9ASTR